MKKLTAGIFSILLGMVAVNSADAAVASKGYVDSKVGENTSSIQTLTQTVADNKTAAENLLNSYKETNDAAVEANAGAIAENKELIQSNATAIGSNTEAIAAEKTARENADNEIKATIGTLPEGVKDVVSYIETESDTTALAGRVETAESDIDALQASLAEGGATANAIAQALADAKSYSDEKDEAQTADLQTYADTAETDAVASANSYTDTEIAKLTSTENGILKQAKDYADGLASNYDTAGSAAQALADAKAYADTAETDAVASANTYTDGEIDKLEQSLGTTSSDLTSLTTRVTTAEGEIDALQVVADTVTNATTGLAATRTLAQQGVTDAAAAQAAAETAQTQADKGVADAATAQAAAEAAQATANAAIPAPTAQCSDKGNKCVLVVGESGYAWEVIERGTGEVIE